MYVKEYCLLLRDLFNNCNQTSWAITFDKFYKKLESGGDVNNIKRKMIELYAGTGSFNDIVFYKGDSVDVSNCNELDRLRHGLWEALVE